MDEVSPKAFVALCCVTDMCKGCRVSAARGGKGEDGIFSIPLAEDVCSGMACHALVGFGV